MAMKWVLLLLCVINFPYCLFAIGTILSVANVSTSWTNNDFMFLTKFDFYDGSMIRTVLLHDSNTSSTLAYGCGFYRNPITYSYFFVVFGVLKNYRQILWTANRDNPVEEDAVLDFSKDGVLKLIDANGTSVWSSNTSGMLVKQMKITANGSLVLSTSNELETLDSSIIWQSWDQPTIDALLPGQFLVPGQRLIASASSSDLTPSPYYLSFVDNDLSAFMESNPPQMYLKVFREGSESVNFGIGSLKVISTAKNPIAVQYIFEGEDVTFVKLDPDGHLRVYTWAHSGIFGVDDNLKYFEVVNDILIIDVGSGNYCIYPTVCGNYGICTNLTSCSCPEGNDKNTSYFMESNSGPRCIEVVQLNCQYSYLHSFIELKEVSYFGFVTTLHNIDQESCKEACLKNCSCRAALFRYNMDASSGNCSLPSQVFSLMSVPHGVVPYNSTSFIKVQRLSGPSTPSKELIPILGSIFAALAFAVLLIWISVRIIRKRRYIKEQGRLNIVDEEWEKSLSLVQDLPTRFSYEDLASMTDNFIKKLGGGGFGSVYEGTLSDGTKIAVKRLDLLGQGKKEFLAEVKTIGSTHHINLVKLMGFCAENSHRLLVYEYMSNGSLEKWIFNKNPESALRWEIRKRIILNIAKGLAYLHDDCRMRIAHLDIKPQNILLDDNFNAKISDFGLARLIDRNQSQVITQMRGTRGYMAPEWLSRKITEKVDVYSFGVVVLEVVCGRRNMNFSLPEEDDHLLLPIVKQKAEENRLYDLVDKCIEDMQQHLEEAEKMLRIGIWCLQSDSTRRPSMSVVGNVLEGVMVMEPISDYSFLTSTVVEAPIEAVFVPSNPQPASVLSGPR